MLYPQSNSHRTLLDLTGFWDLKADPDEEGENMAWTEGIEPDHAVGVPGSWDEQLAEAGLMNYQGMVWYQKFFHLPDIFKNRRIILRFGSADFLIRLWINGKLAGQNNLGFLPFEFDITNLVTYSGKNVLVACIDNRLSHESIPQGIHEEDFIEFGKERDLTFPSTIYDFYNYGGIHRTVHLAILNPDHIKDIALDTKVSGNAAIIRYKVDLSRNIASAALTVGVFDSKDHLVKENHPDGRGQISGEISLADCNLWSPEDPYLYTLKFTLSSNSKTVDTYEMQTGVRAIEVKKDRLLLNGKPIFLQGFGKHEDFPVIGKGLSSALIVKDLQLLKWLGANSFRTSHYPYSEEIMQMADKMGFLVIDEVPAVSLNFRYVNEETLKNHKASLTRLINRDRHHPSVIAWSIANEPGIWGEPEAVSQRADDYWKILYTLVKETDNSRPVTLPTCAKWGLDDLAYKYCDFISINRYWGWYEIPGDIEKAGRVLGDEMKSLYDKYRKPVMLTEFGADTVEGAHATFPQLFTEEYQQSLILKYFDIIESLSFAIGEHIWNFADFRTAQNHRRVIFNKKGVFTRDREPKSVAFAIRDRWLKTQ